MSASASPTRPTCPPPPVRFPAAIAPLCSIPHWVAWRFELNDKGKWTKVPYQAAKPSKKASSVDSTTWASAQPAVAAVVRGKADGVGFALLDSGLGAFDLDDCRNPSTGEIAPWAAELVKRAASYTEITPSGEGLRIIGRATGERIHRKHKIAGTGGSLETYRRAERYIAVTGRQLEGTPDTLADLDGLMDEAVARLDQTNGAAQEPEPTADKRANGHDKEASVDELLARCATVYRRTLASPPLPGEDRSKTAWSVVCSLISKGFTDEEITRLFLAHPEGIGERYPGGKGLAAELIRARKKHRPSSTGVRSTEPPKTESPKADNEPEDYVARLNRDHCVVSDGGRTRVLSFKTSKQKEHTRLVPVFQSFDDFRNFYLNQKVRVGDKDVRLGTWWLQHPERRQYAGLTFSPGAGEVVDGEFNLWRGWGVKPKPGNWSLMRRHIEEVLAAGDPEAATYIINWCAWAFQNPAERAQAALVFRGKRGTGKGTLGNALCRIFGQHATHISSADHLAGKFNGHLRDACLLFADEAYWPGDKGAEGSLKRLITEPDLFVEAKGRDGVTVPNMLHVVMASNDDWIVPAGEAERRYAVFNVAESQMQREAWFAPIYAELEEGGYGAMLHDLLHLDLGDWHPRRVPRTDALLGQQSRGLSPQDSWWVELLETGTLWGAEPGKPNRAVSNGYEDTVEGFHGSRKIKVQCLYDQARAVSPKLRNVSDHALGDFLRDKGCSNIQKVMRRRGWTFPLLAQARAEWDERFPRWPWRDPNLSGWQEVGDGDA